MSAFLEGYYISIKTVEECFFSAIEQARTLNDLMTLEYTGLSLAVRLCDGVDINPEYFSYIADFVQRLTSAVSAQNQKISKERAFDA